MEIKQAEWGWMGGGGVNPFVLLHSVKLGIYAWLAARSSAYIALYGPISDNCYPNMWLQLSLSLSLSREREKERERARESERERESLTAVCFLSSGGLMPSRETHVWPIYFCTSWDARRLLSEAGLSPCFCCFQDNATCSASPDGRVASRIEHVGRVCDCACVCVCIGGANGAWQNTTNNWSILSSHCFQKPGDITEALGCILEKSVIHVWRDLFLCKGVITGCLWL